MTRRFSSPGVFRSLRGVTAGPTRFINGCCLFAAFEQQPELVSLSIFVV